MVAGVIAGLITSGWTGLLVVGFGQIAGQVVVLVMSYVAGRPVPIDPFSAIIATLWFGVPIAIGYGLARLGSRIVSVARGPKGPPKSVDAPKDDGRRARGLIQGRDAVGPGPGTEAGIQRSYRPVIEQMHRRGPGAVRWATRDRTAPGLHRCESPGTEP